MLDVAMRYADMSDINTDTDNNTDIPKPLCVFCGAPWTDEMIKVSAQAKLELGFYPDDISVAEIAVKIDIICSSCDLLVYRKECAVR